MDHVLESGRRALRPLLAAVLVLLLVGAQAALMVERASAQVGGPVIAETMPSDKDPEEPGDEEPSGGGQDDDGDDKWNFFDWLGGAFEDIGEWFGDLFGPNDGADPDDPDGGEGGQGGEGGEGGTVGTTTPENIGNPTPGNGDDTPPPGDPANCAWLFALRAEAQALIELAETPEEKNSAIGKLLLAVQWLEDAGCF